MVLRIGPTETATVRTPLPQGVFPDLSHTLEVQFFSPRYKNHFYLQEFQIIIPFSAKNHN